MSDENQRRRNTRFPVQQSLLAVSKGRELSGICRDINAEGVFFFTSTPLTEGDQVEIRLNLPAGTIFSDEVSLLASGKALRIECNDGDGRCGVAVAFEHIEIHHSSSTSGGSD